MKRQEILWRNPEFVEMANKLAEETMAKLLPEAREILNRNLDDLDPKRRDTAIESRNRTLSSMMQTMKAAMGSSPPPRAAL